MGDEPVLIAQRTSAPVAISPDRRQSIELLHKAYHPQVIISDDGLQHYKLQRDLELVVVDGERRFGNGLLLPAGPLRELPKQRLKTVDAVICNGGTAQDNEILMTLRSGEAVNLLTNERRALTQFTQVNAIAGMVIRHVFHRFGTSRNNAVIQHRFPGSSRFSGIGFLRF